MFAMRFHYILDEITFSFIKVNTSWQKITKHFLPRIKIEREREKERERERERGKVGRRKWSAS